jgi:adenine/guanine phosphoribosyltransferase-like PRPP-binding protein
MNVRTLFTALALIGSGAMASAQDAATATQHVYMVGKVDANTVIITEVMEVATDTTREQLMAQVRTAHPEVVLPASCEGMPFATAAAAESNRTALLARYEKLGKKVTVLKAQ